MDRIAPVGACPVPPEELDWMYGSNQSLTARWTDRICRFLAAAGVFSRREIELLYDRDYSGFRLQMMRAFAYGESILPEEPLDYLAWNLVCKAVRDRLVYERPTWIDLDEEQWLRFPAMEDFLK